MKLKDIQQGTRAIRIVSLPLVNVRCELLPDLPELAEQRAKDATDRGADVSAKQPEVKVGLRVLLGDEYATILERAVAFATARGSKDPRPGDALYDYGEIIHRVALAAVDPDSDPKAPEPFFASVEEILTSPHLGRDGIMLLAEQQETWQDLCSPQALSLNPGEMLDLIGKAAAASTPDFFERLRPGMRWILLRTMAALLSNSQTDSLLPGSTTEAAGESTKKPERSSGE